MTPIAEYIQSGETPQTGRVGVEVEHFLLDHVSGHPLTASQVEDMLEVLRPDYDQAFYEDGRSRGNPGLSSRCPSSTPGTWTSSGPGMTRPWHRS